MTEQPKPAESDTARATADWQPAADDELTCETIAERFAAGETIWELMRDYNRTAEFVLRSIRWVLKNFIDDAMQDR